ncbi:MAG: hypothetical protein JW882_16240 [Deltaproteobacteria bacterium]|nr:hypothetical protein [Deltaproteobacteria bacterium]
MDKVKNKRRHHGKRAKIVSFHPCITADHQIILGSRGLNERDHSLIDKAEAIILPQSCSRDLYVRCGQSAAKIFPNYSARFKYPGKEGQMVMFRETGSPHPETIVWDSVLNLKDSCRNSWPHKLPFFIKEGRSHEGEGVFLVKDRETFKLAMNRLYRNDKDASNRVISQELIQCEGNVLRVVIIGAEIFSYWKRPLKSGQIITNACSGAKIDKAWRKDLQEVGSLNVRRLSESMSINLAAFDLVFSIREREPRPFFLEINYFFGRRGLGGSRTYYRLLFNAIRAWLSDENLDPESIALI